MFSQTELENMAFPLDGNVRISLRSILDACIAFSFGLEYEDLEQILAECNLPSSDLKRNRPPSLSRNPKGFWRVDKHLPSGSRQTIRTLAAFKRIEGLGIEAVLRETFENLPGKLNYSELVSHARRMSAIRAYSH
jgi:hypothetical protein